MATEISLQDTTVMCAIEDGTPGFKFFYTVR